MKKIITLLLLIICLHPLKAQTVTIPDANFVTWLQANVPSAMTGNQLDTTSLAVTTRNRIQANFWITNLYGIQFFDSLKFLNVGNIYNGQIYPNSLSTLPTLPHTLDTLICNRNNLTSLPFLPSTLKYLDCGSNQLTTLPLLPNSLKTLNYSSNGITNISVLPNTLVELDCSLTQTSNLPALPNTLTSLNCYYNNLSILPALPSSLKYLDCNVNQISVLGVLPNKLVTLFCTSNQLTNLPILPDSLRMLGCLANQLTNLPALPPLLYLLNCEYNSITNLPTLSDSLQYLFCDNNQLTSLPALPDSLKRLLCNNNQLVSLPNLPTHLPELNCSYNQLTSLPTLPIVLGDLECSHNLLTSLPILPPTLYTLDCSSNNISCFSNFSEPWFIFDISNNPFTCLPNYIQDMNVATLNYPLCVSGNTLTNPNGCTTGKGITGITYNDINTNCVKNTGELNARNVAVKLYDISNVFIKQTGTYGSGIYYFNDTTGIYHVILDTVNKPFIVQCIIPGIDSLVTLTPTHTLEDSVDYALTCKPGFDVGIQSIVTSGIVFPGQNHILNVNAGDVTHWYNLNCASGVAGTISFSVNGPVTYVGPAAGALTPNIIGNVYTYIVSDFGVVNNTNDFKLVFQTNTTALTGNVICVNATVTPISGDNIPQNNTSQFCYNVVNSLDPNIKEVYPVEVQTGFNDWLTYTIHFQNTGNAAAINIRLEDELDAKLDPETFQLINYSHNNVIDVTGNHLTVRFPNIQLADSTSNPSGSIAFVQYRIKPKAGWVTDTIKNTASIYFDYNAPIITNTAKSYFMTATNVKDNAANNNDVSMIPNPTNGSITINSQYDFNKIQLLNITGQTLLSETTTGKNHQLQLQNFADGIYFMKISFPNGLITTKKIVVYH